MKGDSIPIPNSIKWHLKALSILLSLAKESFFFFYFSQNLLNTISVLNKKTIFNQPRLISADDLYEAPPTITTPPPPKDFIHSRKLWLL